MTLFCPPPSAFRLLLFSALSAFPVVNAFALDVPDTATVAADTAVASVRQISPRGAAFRSMALPGWGQFCNRRPVKGGILAAAYAASLSGIVVRQRQLDREARRPGFDPSRPRRNLFIFTTLGLIFYSAVDAYVDAHLSEGVTFSATGDNGMAVCLIFTVRKGRYP